MAHRPVLTIGISGSSSAGKTTLCALLQLVLAPLLDAHASTLLMLHCDAFSKEFEELPTHASGFLDAECPASVQFDRVVQAIDEVRRTGRSPPEDRYPMYEFIENDLAKARGRLEANPDLLTELTQTLDARVESWTKFKAICFVDGFLLYHDPVVRSKLDFGLFLRTSKINARKRRSGRYDESEPPEGSAEFWKTERYFEEVVWPSYVEQHAFLFPGGDVEAPLRKGDLKVIEQDYRLFVMPAVGLDLEESLRWAVSALQTALVEKS